MTSTESPVSHPTKGVDTGYGVVTAKAESQTAVRYFGTVRINHVDYTLDCLLMLSSDGTWCMPGAECRLRKAAHGWKGMKYDEGYPTDKARASFYAHIVPKLTAACDDPTFLSGGEAARIRDEIRGLREENVREQRTVDELVAKIENRERIAQAFEGDGIVYTVYTVWGASDRFRREWASYPTIEEAVKRSTALVSAIKAEFGHLSIVQVAIFQNEPYQLPEQHIGSWDYPLREPVYRSGMEHTRVTDY
jgi:hypothetical protein